MIILYVLAALVLLLVSANLVFGRLPAAPAEGGGRVPTTRGELHYLESVGEGTPVIFIHGMPGIANEFDPVREAYGEGHLLAFDRPGYAWSNGAPQSFSDQLDAIVEAANTLGIKRAVVVGHSFGGLVALGLAIRHAEFVDRLLLLAPAAGGTRIGEQRMRQARLIQKLELPVIRQIADVFFLRLLRRHASRLGATAAYGESPGTAKQRLLAESVLARHNSIRALANDRLIFNEAERMVSGNLDRVSVPTIIVHGERDTTVPLRNGQRLAEALPGTQLRVVDGDHQLPAKNTSEVVAALRELNDL